LGWREGFGLLRGAGEGGEEEKGEKEKGDEVCGVRNEVWGLRIVHNIVTLIMLGSLVLCVG